MQVVPGQRVQLTYLVPNPADSTLYYVQAVVKNTSTNKVIATVNLVQDSNQAIRYTGSFTAPLDSVGNGYFMDAVSIPYTDSGYTTPSPNYGAALTQIFAYQLPSTFSGGGGSEIIVDYDRIEELLAGKFSGIKFPEQKQVIFPDFPEIPQPKEVDLRPVMDICRTLISLIKTVQGNLDVLQQKIVIIEAKETDLSGVYNVISHLEKKLLNRIESVETTGSDGVKEVRKEIKDIVESINSEMMKFRENPIPFQIVKERTNESPLSHGDIFKRLSKK